MKNRRKRKSCKSHGERIITETLNKLNINYIREYSFSDCRSLNNYPLRFDFYCPDYNLLIEFQGKHHYEPVNKYPKAKRVTEKTKINDQIKINYCQSRNIDLITIPYWELENISFKLPIVFLSEENK